jgi:regulator of sigma E protease
MDFVYFILLVGVLIFVHELGHFAWAKFWGVKVLTFSLGFGPRLIGFRKGETEYRLAAFPLGGYVKMLGESPNDVIAPEDEDRAFSTQPLFKKVIIVFAGPAMNLLFPIALYFLVFLGDTQLPPPVIGTVFPDRPAYGKLVAGDRVLSIDDEEISTFGELRRIVAKSPGVPLDFVVERDGQEVETTITPVMTRVSRELDIVESVGRIGISPYHPTAVVGVTSPNSPAGAARMRPFDVVVAAGGQPVDKWLDLERILGPNRGTLVPITYIRPVRVEQALGGLVEIDVYEPHVATLTPEPGPAGTGVQRAGLERADLYVSHVVVGSEEQRIGIRPGDRLVALDGEPIVMWATFIEDLKAGDGRERQLTLRTGEQERTVSWRLRHERRVDEYGQQIDRFDADNIMNWVPATPVAEPTENPTPVRYAFSRAVESTREMIELTVYSAIRLFQGQLTVKSIGGPITVFEVAGTAAREGTINFLEVMAFISVNLGLINLLPIPLLDGGHLLFFLMEAVSRRKVSTKVRQYASLAGLTILILLMAIAFKNDIERNWSDGEVVGAP